MDMFTSLGEKHEFSLMLLCSSMSTIAKALMSLIHDCID